jgi:hypothetical protein
MNASATWRIIARGGYQPDAAPGEQRDTQFLQNQVVGKAAGILDKDNADAVAFDAVEEHMY